MINSYIILNRKTSFIIKFFLINILILTILTIIGINTLYYQTFIQIHAKIIHQDSNYYIETLIPTNKITKIKNSNQIIINSNTYNYSIFKIDSNAIYKNNQNYQKIYLLIKNLDQSLLINNYEFNAKIPDKHQKVINYLKNKEED